MSFARSWIILLALSAGSARAEGEALEAVAALEKAYAARPAPEIALGLASLYAAEGRCEAEIGAFRRFFDTCRGCAAADIAEERIERALFRCIADPKERLVARERFDLPASEGRAANPADASVREVSTLIAQALEIDQVRAGLLVLALESPRREELAFLNGLRAQAWEILASRPANAEQVHELLLQIRKIDGAAYDELLIFLADAESRSDAKALDAIRARAIGLIAAKSSTGTAARLGCQANLGGEPGYLTIDTRPWSRIYVNGEDRGVTPLARLRVVAGCTTVVAVEPDSGERRSLTVTVRPNLTAIVKLDIASGAQTLGYR